MALAVFVGTAPSAHRLDEYLQAARIAVDPDRVGMELDLTPGSALAETIIAEIDHDGDGMISRVEQRAYAARVLSAVHLEADGQTLDVQLVALTFPDLDDVRQGEGIIRLQTNAVLPMQAPGTHQLLFRNSHHPDIGVYLANALVPASDRIAVTAQRRTGDQRELTIVYTMRVAPALITRPWVVGGLAGMAVAAGLVMRRARVGRRAASSSAVGVSAGPRGLSPD